MSESPASHRTDRVDFRATSDPALDEAADRGEANLLTHAQLYDLWERQHWTVQELDFTQDRVDWHERFDEDERFQRMYGISAFFVGEQRVAAELGPIMRAVPDEDMRIFLCTQIADEARHVAFFDRFYSEVGVLKAGSLEERLATTSEHLTPECGASSSTTRCTAASTASRPTPRTSRRSSRRSRSTTWCSRGCWR